MRSRIPLLAQMQHDLQTYGVLRAPTVPASGAQEGPLVTKGVYCYSRNPQYLGYIVGLAGLAVARRSGAGLWWGHGPRDR